MAHQDHPVARSRRIGSRTVSGIGLGAMHLSVVGRPDRDRALATVRAAVEAGVTVIDTADSYSIGPDDLHHNEMLIAEALLAMGSLGRGVLVATKGGHTRPGGGWAVDGRPEHLREACHRSLRALGTDCIGLYQLHRPDPQVPYEESVGALKELRESGLVDQVGISNATVEHIRSATAVLGPGGLAAVQNELSPRARHGAAELEECARLGIAYLLYSPLGGAGVGPHLQSSPVLERIARARDVSAQQVALAWELSLGDHVLPIPGCSRPETARDCAMAGQLQLTLSELAELDAAFPVLP
jgi:aryl-alcohol dehydrogenase-like predicted oxidoreductase